MKTIHHERFSTFALLLAALAVPMGAQAQTQAPTAAKAPVVKPAPTADTLARPAGLQGSPITMTAPEAAPPKKPGQEGVTMHGHWVIDLRNPDGSIAAHRDFENALLTPSILLQLVSGQYVMGDLGITIASTGSAVCASGGAGSLGSCLVAASSTAGLGGYTCGGATTGYCNDTLKESVSSSGAITLMGTMPVLGTGAVTQVGTQYFACNSGGAGTFGTVDPIGCYNQTEGAGYQYANLTGTTIPTLNVTTGQTIVFTVVLTFS